jgi:hypothetical protein
MQYLKERALEIIQQGPVTCDDLANELQTSKRITMDVVYQLRKEHSNICVKGETVYIPHDKLAPFIFGSLAMLVVPVMLLLVAV